MLLTSLWIYLLGSPVKLAVWVGNRIAAWTTLGLIWQRIRHDPNRLLRFFLWVVMINSVSIGLLFAVYRWWKVR